MMNFLKRNWLWLIIILVLIFGQNLFSSLNIRSPKIGSTVNTGYDSLSIAPSSSIIRNTTQKISSGVALETTSNDRMVIENTNLSLRVDDVDKSIAGIKKTAEDFGGFLINSSVSKPEEAASGSISVRIPKDKKTDAIDAFKKMGNKVVSENIFSDDITDEYQDLNARLEVLTKTKSKYENILEKADKVSDLLEVQQQLINLQSQIDSIKGQQKYYDQSVNLTKVTIYLSTDEIALPYTPSNTWEPKAIFKNATRSLIETFRSIGSFFIWVVVYIPIILPVVLVILFIKKRKAIKAKNNLA